MKKKIKIFYDGGCVFCNNYIQLVKLKKDFDVSLVNLRDNLEDAKNFFNRGINVDEGMIIEIEDKIYFGANAMIFLSKYDKATNLYNFLINKIFKLNLFPNLIYRLFKLIRFFVLKLRRTSYLLDEKYD